MSSTKHDEGVKVLLALLDYVDDSAKDNCTDTVNSLVKEIEEMRNDFNKITKIVGSSYGYVTSDVTRAYHIASKYKDE